MNDTWQESDTLSLIYSLTLTTLCAVGLLLNLYILFVIVLTKQAWSAPTVLLVHLGATGLLASGAALGGGGRAPAVLLAALHPLQLWTVCGLHADRCAAIVAPLHYSAIVSARKAMASVAGGWSLTLVIVVPLLISLPPLTIEEDLQVSAPDCGAGTIAIAYCVMYTALTLIVPAILVLLCSLKILRIARYHRHRIAAAIFEVTLSAQVTVTHQRNPFSPPPPPKQRSALTAVLQPLASLACLYFPYYGVFLWRAIMPPPFVLSAIASALIAAAPSVNGILYGIRSRNLKDSLRNYRRKRITKSEVTQEIQARTPSVCGSRRPSLSGSGNIRVPPVRRLSDAATFVTRSTERPAPRASSCNTLGAANEEARSAIPIIRAPAHVVVGRALGLEDSNRRRRSPRITVTRALSDECDSPTRRISRTPRRPLCRQQSRSSGALLCGGATNGLYSSPARSEESKESGEEQLLLSWRPQPAI